MTIVCLGWGSLILAPGDLPLRTGWSGDGPKLPVEFARKSKDGRITLVVSENTPSVDVLWTALAVQDMDEAKRALKEREDTVAKNIGFWNVKDCSDHGEARTIAVWAAAKGFDGVVWTALPPKFPDISGKPSCDEVVEYLRTLEGSTRLAAEKYVRSAPDQIQTPYRDAIERELGWTPVVAQQSSR